jgi:ketosteroid isomerase-like protein
VSERETVEMVTRIYDRWNAGDVEAVIASMHEDVEYVNPDYAVEPGTRRGHTGMREAMVENLDVAFSSYEHEVHEVIVVEEEHVLTLLTFRACGRDSGARIEVDEQHLWTLRDGRVARIEWFHDEAAARRAAGVG